MSTFIPAYGDYHWKPTVDIINNLPTFGNNTGDARVVSTIQTIYIWSGSAWVASSGGGSGTVTSVSVVTANGVSGSVATSTTTPAITLTLGAVTPSSVAASGSVTGSNLSGTNTGDITLGTADGLSLAGQVLSLGLASTSTTGALSSTDWNTFNGKTSGGITSLTGPLTASGPGASAVSITAQTGTGTTFAMQTSPSFITPILGVASSTSTAHTGTGGAGFSSFVSQSSPASAPASGFSLFADSTGRFSWIRQSDGFIRTWDSALTANRIYTLPDASTTVVGTDTTQTLTNKTISPASNTIPLVTTIGVTLDGGGAAIVPGTYAVYTIPYAATINSVTLLADQSGSIVLDVKKSTYSGYPNTSSITASAQPTLSGAQKSQDTTLTGWTTSLSAGDVLQYVVNSASTVQRVTLSLKITRV